MNNDINYFKIADATPKRIWELMNEEGLTKSQVKSHLQVLTYTTCLYHYICIYVYICLYYFGLCIEPIFISLPSKMYRITKRKKNMQGK